MYPSPLLYHKLNAKKTVELLIYLLVHVTSNTHCIMKTKLCSNPYPFSKVIDEQNDVQLPAAIKVIMDTWTCQSGFPLLTVNFSTGNISQEKFYIAGVKNNEVKNSTK